MLPKVARPSGGLEMRKFEDVKRARVDFTSTVESIANAAYASNTSNTGVGSHAHTGGQTDISVRWTFKVVPLEANDWVYGMPMQGLVFIMRGQPQFFRSADDANRVIALCLPQLHYHIHKSTLRQPTKWGPEEVLKNWMLAGPNISTTPLPGKEHMERTIEIVSQGDYRIINYWGPDVHGGDYLWLVCKEVEVGADTSYVTDKDGIGNQKPGILCTDGKTLLTHVTQFVPIISETRTHPKFKDLLYMKDCCIHVGIPVFVARTILNRGFSRSVRMEGTIDPTLPSATTSTALQGRAGLIEVYGDMAKKKNRVRWG